MAKVTCIGSVAKDIFYPIQDGTVLETPEDVLAKRKVAFELGAKYLVDDSFESLGGGAANISAGLAKLGIEAEAHGRIGDDEMGNWIKDSLIRSGVSTSHVQIGQGESSDSSLILAHGPTKDRIIFYNRDANENLVVEPEALKSEYVFVSSLSGNSSNTWANKLNAILDLVVREGMSLVFNPGQRNISENPSLVVRAISLSRILIMNKDEAIGIILAIEPSFERTRLEDEGAIIHRLQALGPETVVVTDGRRGAWAGIQGKIFFSEPLDLGVIDTTGAGDAFSSAFLAASVKGLGPDKALAWGIVNSANVVRYYGGHEGLLEEKDIFEQLVKVEVKNLV